MKNRSFKSPKGLCGLVLFIIFPIVSFNSCVYDQEMTYLNDQMIALNKRVTKLEELVGSNLDTRLGSVYSRQAEVGAEMDQLKTTVSELSGRIEDNEQLIKRSVEKDLGKEDAIAAGLAALSQKVSELEVLVTRQQEHLGLKTPGPKDVQGQVRTPSGRAGTPPKRPVITEEPRSEELNLYDTSMAAFREGKYEDAMEGFEALLKKYPTSDRADNAQFWIGECYMGIKQYEKAILAYQEVIKKYPKGNKVPSAMLRQAIAFLEIKDETSTRLLLKKIINKYPDSSEAEIAKRKLETLK
jgi:tol-pal system protein YbgF